MLMLFSSTALLSQEVNNDGLDNDGDCNIDCSDMSFGTRSFEFTNGMDYEYLIGQDFYTDNLPGNDEYSFDKPYDIAKDPTSDKVFVSDSKNNRVLRFATLHDFLFANVPESVFGQTDFFSKVADVSSSAMSNPAGIFVDDSGSLWVCDHANNRVLMFANASDAPINASADLVLGQAGFNTSFSSLGASGMDDPSDIVLDASGTLYVSDTKNNRILRFDNASSKSNGANADGVLGAPNFNDAAKLITNDDIGKATGVAIVCNSLYASDGSNHRIMRWDDPASLSNGAPADGVLGQISFVTGNSGMGQNRLSEPRLLSKDKDNNLYVSDGDNHRVLIFNEVNAKGIGAGADVVIGQSNFNNNMPGLSVNEMDSPRGVSVIEDGFFSSLVICDRDNHRIVVIGPQNIKTNEMTDVSGTLTGYDPSGSGGLMFTMVSQPEVGSVSIDNAATGAYTYHAGGACPYDENYLVRFKYKISNANGCETFGEVVIQVSNVNSCSEINGNGIDDDGDCNTDCDDLSFAIGTSWFTSGMEAGFVVGQDDFNTNISGFSPNRYNHPYDIAVDPNSQKVFVSDAQNNRVLRYKSYNDFLYEKTPEIAFGQSDLVSNGAFAGQSGLDSPTGIFVDINGVLWVCDYGNNRVLRFDNASIASMGASANGVLGQVNFAASSSGLAAGKMNRPMDAVVDENGNLYIADQFNGRVLRFDNAAAKANGANANGVLGAATMTSHVATVSVNNIDVAGGLVIICDELYVSDETANRVLVWDNPSTQPNGADAKMVLGQTDFISSSSGTSNVKFNKPRFLAKDNSNNLYVTDANNHRVLVFFEPDADFSGTSADVVIGQGNFNIGTSGLARDRLNQPRGVAVCQIGSRTYVNVVDRLNNRVLVYGSYNYQVNEMVTLNDFLPWNDPAGNGGLSFTLLSQPGVGTVTVNPTSGSFVYTPIANPCAFDYGYFETFSYQVTNSVGCTAIGDLQLHINEVQSCLENCNNGIDDDNNGFIDAQDPMCDFDGDGVINSMDIDKDNDGIIDSIEEDITQYYASEKYVYLRFETFGGVDGFRGSSNETALCHEDGTNVTCSSVYNSATYTAGVNEGEYAVVQSTDEANQGTYNWISKVASGWPDGSNSRLMVVNPAHANQVVYELEVSGAINGAKLQFGASFTNLFASGSGMPIPRIGLQLYDANGVLMKNYEYNLPEDEQGRSISSSIILDGQAPYTFKIVSVNPGGLGNDFIIDSIEISASYKDNDYDGIINIYDLDSDNDGIPDIAEQNGVDADHNGMTDNVTGAGVLTNDANSNGADDIYEGQAMLDTDGDERNDVHDRDSDNDGIYDVIEAGGIDGDFDGVIGSGSISDPNKNGMSAIIDVEEGGTPLTNGDSDADGTQDIKESDSDADGCFDVKEAGFLDGDNNGYLGTGTYGAGLTVNKYGVVTP